MSHAVPVFVFVDGPTLSSLLRQYSGPVTENFGSRSGAGLHLYGLRGADYQKAAVGPGGVSLAISA